MTITQAVAGFAIIAGLLTIVPGMDTALILRGTISRSKTYGVATAAGVQVGVLIWGAAAATGAAALLEASQTAYRVLTLVGAAYMVWLGVSMLRSSFREPAGDEFVVPVGSGAGRGFGMGLVTNLSNPKVGGFYVATIPQFVPEGVSPLWMGLLLASVHCLLGTFWSAGVILGSGYLKDKVAGSAVVRWADRVAGGVLVLFGARLALESRA